jgi:ABC-2 type transport system ATP-binding protein
MTPRSTAPLIDVHNLGKTYPAAAVGWGALRWGRGAAGSGTVAVQSLSFNVQAGELVGLMGPNGAGNSTTMRMLAGFVAPTTGYACIAGHNVATARVEALKNLGYLAEQPGVFDELNGHAYLVFMAQAHALADVPGALATAAKLTRCAPYLNRPLGELSKGMRQRIMLAGALIHNPPVLILDEPTDGLDPNQKHELRLVLKELARHKAVLLSTHILEEAEAVCSRVIMLHGGKKLLDTTPAELARQGKGDIQLAFRVLTQNRGHASI